MMISVSGTYKGVANRVVEVLSVPVVFCDSQSQSCRFKSFMEKNGTTCVMKPAYQLTDEVIVSV